MTPWLNRLLARPTPTLPISLPIMPTIALRHAELPPPPPAPGQDRSGCPPAPREDTADTDPPACGWFDSSHALREGLAVREWPADDWATAALYFVRPSGPAARLQ